LPGKAEGRQGIERTAGGTGGLALRVAQRPRRADLVAMEKQHRAVGGNLLDG
jgi:hypothetical protein